MPRKPAPWYRTRYVRELVTDIRPSIRSPQDVREAVADLIPDDREAFLAVYLDTRHRLIHVDTVSIGSLNASIVHPREVFRRILQYPRPIASVILIHNHPSGDPTPSEDDVELTQRLCKAGDMLGIEILDHIILGECRQVFSLREAGLL